MQDRAKVHFVLLACLLSGLSCASGDAQLHPGLANAPALGGTRSADPRVHDAVANGNDSCERHGVGGSPLRDRLPPCPGTETSPQVLKVVYDGDRPR